jgi:hypothetical protein
MNTFVQGSYSPLPRLCETPRVARDIEQILAFIARQPWGDPIGRKKDIQRGIAQILEEPGWNKVSIRRRTTGIELRRHNVAQLSIIYAYTAPNAEHPHGLVSTRAIRHRRVNNVFPGVRESHPVYASHARGDCAYER